MHHPDPEGAGGPSGAESREAAAALWERTLLLQRLTRISRSISHRAPLQEVLDAITRGACDLLEDSVVGLRLIDEEDPGSLVLVSAQGVSSELLAALRRGPVGEGVGGRAISEDRLVVIERYDRSEQGLPAFRAAGLQTAMGAPVRSEGKVVGSLTVASYVPGRRYSPAEREALLALADHASVALTDARTVAALRDAQAAKDLFLAMISHELKTPLTVIMGTLRTLERHGSALPQDRQRDMLSAAYSRGQDLERLIDSLLRGAHGDLVATPPTQVSLDRFVTDVVAGFPASDRLTVGLLPDASLLLDVPAARAALAGLLDNALAHAPAEAPITLEAKADATTVTLVVANPGTLPPEMTGSGEFEPFRRGPDARSSGVGLGLHLASRLARSVGGAISGAADGATVSFCLLLPRAQTCPARPDR